MKKVYNILSFNSVRNLDNFQKPSFTKLLNKYSLNYKFQKYKLLYIFLFALNLGTIGYSIPYFFYEPEFFCFNKISNNYIRCPIEKACITKNYNVNVVFNSFISDYQLYCNREYLKNILSSLVFIFAGISCFFLIYITDNYGKKKAIIWSLILVIVGGLYTFNTNMLINKVLGFCFVFTGSEYFFTIAFIYINEIFNSENRLKIVTQCYFFWALGGLIVNVVTSYFSSYLDLLKFQLFLTTISIILSFNIIESPCFLILTNNYKKLYKFFINLTKFNKIDNKNLEVELNLLLNYYNNKKQNEVNTSLSETTSMIQIDNKKLNQKEILNKLISDKKSIIKLICITIILSSTYILYGLTLIGFQFIGSDDIHFNGAVLAIFEMIGYLVIIPFSSNIKRKYFLLKSNYFIGFLGFLTFFWYFLKYVSFINILLTLLSGILKLLISCNLSIQFLYLSELFDMKLRNYACGIVLFIARTLSILSVLLWYFSIKLDIHPFFLSCILILLSNICLNFLPETFKNKINK